MADGLCSCRQRNLFSIPLQTNFDITLGNKSKWNDKKKLLRIAPTCIRKVLLTKFSKHDAKFVPHSLSNAQKQLPWQTDKYYYSF